MFITVLFVASAMLALFFFEFCFDGAVSAVSSFKKLIAAEAAAKAPRGAYDFWHDEPEGPVRMTDDVRRAILADEPWWIVSEGTHFGGYTTEIDLVLELEAEAIIDNQEAEVMALLANVIRLASAPTPAPAPAPVAIAPSLCGEEWYEDMTPEAQAAAREASERVVTARERLYTPPPACGVPEEGGELGIRRLSRLRCRLAA